MRAFLLCAALLALLAAPAQANKFQPKWPGQRPRPFKAVGTLLAGNSGEGFNDAPYTWEADGNGNVNIVSNPNIGGLAWFLTGNTDNSEALTSVSWAYGAVVNARLDRWGNLAASLNNRAIFKGRPLKLGPLVSITLARDTCNRRGCADRTLEIVVRPFITVVIRQPWIAGHAFGAKGGFAPFLEVQVTLTQAPTHELTGVLGATLSPPVEDNALQAKLKTAKIIPDVIASVAPISGLSMEVTFDGRAFNSGALITDLAPMASPLRLLIKGARPGDKFTLFVVDPDAPSPKTPTDRSYLHGIWYNIPWTGDMLLSETVLSKWIAPNGGVPGTGPHRYVFLLYKQPVNGAVKFAQIDVRTTSLAKYDVTKSAAKAGLGTNPQPVDVAWFLGEAKKP